MAPTLLKLLPDYPQINVEVDIDFGVRLGERVAKDMLAVRISPDFRGLVVGTPAYFATRNRPRVPQDLTGHNCINIRFPTHGGLHAWDSEKDGREVKIEGQLTLNSAALRLSAALAGQGLVYLPEDSAAPYLADGRLVAVLEDWCAPSPGYYLYYPNRRHASLAFSMGMDALRQHGN